VPTLKPPDARDAHLVKRFACAEVGVLEHGHGSQGHGLETVKHHERHGSHFDALEIECPKTVL
jgi:hypothetical protein